MKFDVCRMKELPTRGGKSKHSTERRISETLFVFAFDLNHKFTPNYILLQQTHLHVQNNCTINIRQFMHTIIIMGFCKLLQTAILPADVALL